MFIISFSMVMAFFSPLGRVSPQPLGKTIMRSVKTPTISEMPLSTVLDVFNC